MSVEELVREAMKLSTDERELLAAKLLSSLDSGLDFEAEWREEASRRAIELRERRVEEISGEEVFREALDRLK